MQDPTASAPRTRHSPWEDALAYVLGTSLAVLGLMLLQHAGLITGQTAGLAVLLSYVTGWSFGAVFFVANLPFYWLALRQMGTAFTLRTFVAVALLSGVAELLPELLAIERVHPGAAAALGGGAIGVSLLVIFRHGASLGGIGVLGLFLQERLGVRAGWVQLAFDVALFAAAFLSLDPATVAWSLLGAVVLNVIVGVNHRPDRYTGR